MELVCPECLGSLAFKDENSVVCQTHGGEYEVLFSRLRPPPPRPVAPGLPEPAAVAALSESEATEGGTRPFCTQHPHVAAAFICRHCGKPICNICAFREDDGTAVCPECALTHGTSTAGDPALVEAAAVSQLLPGARCTQHPNLAATQRCKLCGAFMCATCDFALPGNIHVCPKCAATPRSSLSPRRKKFMIGSYALAIWSTIGMTCLLAGVFAEMARSKADQEVLGMVLMLFVMAPAITGLALGVSARDRRLSNPLSITLAIVWNGIIVGSFLLLILYGMTK